MKSLRTRAVSGGILWAVVTIVLGLAGVSSYMDSESRARFVEALQTRHTQAIVATANETANPPNFGRLIVDPVYQRPFSGQYWQIEDSTGQVLVSPSLVDWLLPRPDARQEGIVTREFAGADGEPLLGISQWLTLADGSRWHVQVASSLESLEADQTLLQKNLLSAFAIVSAIAVLAALAQVAVVLQPLNALRKDVSSRWEAEDGLDVKSYPIEVAPLVIDINTLMERNREIMRRSRRQAADLAHAIKTPSAIMRNELNTLRASGVNVGDSIDALNRLDAQLKRSFARIRADGSENAVGAVTDLDTSLGRMQRAFTALAKNTGRSFSASFSEGMRARIDQNDFEEVLGNLLDNALKWSKTRVDLTAVPMDDFAVIVSISDDGPGIPKDAIALATQSGERLDTSKPGTGLGLAIASDLVHAYGGQIHFEASEKLGGLAVHVRLPVAAAGRLAKKQPVRPARTNPKAPARPNR